MTGSMTRSWNGWDISISSSVTGFSREPNSARRDWSGSLASGERKPTITSTIAIRMTTTRPIRINEPILSSFSTDRLDFDADDLSNDQATNANHDGRKNEQTPTTRLILRYEEFHNVRSINYIEDTHQDNGHQGNSPAGRHTLRGQHRDFTLDSNA